MKRPMALIERIPVRWRIAVTTAGLTLAILVIFALVLGNVVGDRIRGDFEDELRGAAGTLAAETQVGVEPDSGRRVISSPSLPDSAMAEHAVIRIVDQFGRPMASSDPSANLGPPRDGINDTGPFRVASEPIASSGGITAFVQYGEPDDDVEASVNRLWLFLAAGVLGGTILALLAGLAVADRAMRPIRSLTALARDIAATRDPSRRMPVPAADDEVGELAETMDGMLEALDEARAERERAFERQREFVADASHELRTPLTSVQANLELLQAALEDAEDRHAIESALGSTKRMSRLVSDLSLLARADAGRRSARTKADLAKIARDALREIEPLVGGRELRIEVEGPLPIEGNPDELHRLIRNLLENACRHTPGDATVGLSAREDDGRAVLEVADDGPGIPKELSGQVFDRFVRGGGPADTAGSGGSGLGLAIVRAVAESHGGTVEAGRSELGGARISVRLPLIQVQERGVDSDVDETQPAEA
jgi:two-component system OmpR family sensor kinase